MLLTSPQLLADSGIRLVALSSTGKFTQAAGKKFRVLDAQGRELVDLAALFDAEHQQAEAAGIGNLAALSATNQKPANTKRERRLPDGRVDLGAIFDDELEKSRLMNQ